MTPATFPRSLTIDNHILIKISFESNLSIQSATMTLRSRKTIFETAFVRTEDRSIRVTRQVLHVALWTRLLDRIVASIGCVEVQIAFSLSPYLLTVEQISIPSFGDEDSLTATSPPKLRPHRPHRPHRLYLSYSYLCIPR